MTDAHSPTWAAEEPVVDADEYRAFVEAMELVRVETLHVQASRLKHGDGTRHEVQTQSSVAVDPPQNAIFYRYDLAGDVVDDAGDGVARVEVGIVLVFRTERTDVSKAVVERFGGTSAYFMAYPYLRETAHSLAARLGLEFLLAMIHG